jgi:hypothetical protein
MEKLIKKLDEIFAKYNVEQEDIAEVGTLISGIGGDLTTEGEDFVEPEMEEVSDVEEAYGD